MESSNLTNYSIDMYQKHQNITCLKKYRRLVCINICQNASWNLELRVQG